MHKESTTMRSAQNKRFRIQSSWPIISTNTSLFFTFLQFYLPEIVKITLFFYSPNDENGTMFMEEFSPDIEAHKNV